MGRFDFQSVGGAMGNSIEEFLMQEEARKRRALLDSIAMQETHARAEDRRQALDNRNYDREGVRAQNWALDHAAGEIDPEMAAIAKKFGLGGGLKDTNLPSGETQLDGETADTVRMRPAITSEGGVRQVQARTALEQKAQQDLQKQEAQAEQKRLDREFTERQAADKREAEDRRTQEKRETDTQRERDKADLQMNLKKMDVDSRANTANITASAKSDATATKTAEKKAADEEADAGRRKTIVAGAEESLGVIDQLLTPEGELQPGVSGITGRGRVPAWATGVPGIREIASGVSGGDISDKQAAFDRLRSQAMVNLINTMKTVSKTGATGFGSLSEAEGKILMNASAQLNQAQTEDQVKTILQGMRLRLNAILLEPKNMGSAATGAAHTTAVSTETPTGGDADISAAKALIDKYRAPAMGGVSKPSAQDLIRRARGQ